MINERRPFLTQARSKHHRAGIPERLEYRYRFVLMPRPIQIYGRSRTGLEPVGVSAQPIACNDTRDALYKFHFTAPISQLHSQFSVLELAGLRVVPDALWHSVNFSNDLDRLRSSAMSEVIIESKR